MADLFDERLRKRRVVAIAAIVAAISAAATVVATTYMMLDIPRAPYTNKLAQRIEYMNMILLDDEKCRSNLRMGIDAFNRLSHQFTVLALILSCSLKNRRKMSNVAQIPTSFGHELRACLRCRLVKTYDQFRESGCENCPFFNMDKDYELVGECTTLNFTGIISVMDPSRSWAARWLRIGRFVPGVYTLAVAETLSEELQAVCQDNRVQYVPPKRV